MSSQRLQNPHVNSTTINRLCPHPHATNKRAWGCFHQGQKAILIKAWHLKIKLIYIIQTAATYTLATSTPGTVPVSGWKVTTTRVWSTWPRARLHKRNASQFCVILRNACAAPWLLCRSPGLSGQLAFPIHNDTVSVVRLFQGVPRIEPITRVEVRGVIRQLLRNIEHDPYPRLIRNVGSKTPVTSKPCHRKRGTQNVATGVPIWSDRASDRVPQEPLTANLTSTSHSSVQIGPPKPPFSVWGVPITFRTPWMCQQLAIHRSDIWRRIGPTQIPSDITDRIPWYLPPHRLSNCSRSASVSQRQRNSLKVWQTDAAQSVVRSPPRPTTAASKGFPEAIALLPSHHPCPWRATAVFLATVPVRSSMFSTLQNTSYRRLNLNCFHNSKTLCWTMTQN